VSLIVGAGTLYCTMRLFSILCVGAVLAVVAGLTASASAGPKAPNGSAQSEKRVKVLPLKPGKPSAASRNKLPEQVIVNTAHHPSSHGALARMLFDEKTSVKQNTVVRQETVVVSRREGAFYVEVEIGGKAYNVQIDTGSHMLAIPVDHCTACDPNTKKYSISGKDTLIDCFDSNWCVGSGFCSFESGCDSCSPSGACCSLINTTSYCAFEFGYGIGDFVRGTLIRDTFELGSTGLQASVVFGGFFEKSSNFAQPPVDGIMGLSPLHESCEPNCVQTVLSSLVSANDDLDDIFAICLTQDSGGVLALGGIPDGALAEPLKWFPYRSGSELYLVDVSSTMYIGDVPVQMNPDMIALVDSGTTELNVPASVAHEFERIVEEQLCEEIGYCLQDWIRVNECYSEDLLPLAHLPTLTFELLGDQNMLIEVEPEFYIGKFRVNGDMKHCIGIQSTFENDVIFGDVVMRKYATVYDRAENRVGFAAAAAGCGSSTPGAVSCSCTMAAGMCLTEVVDGICEETECVKMYCDIFGDLNCELRSKDVLSRCDHDSSVQQGESVCCNRVNGTVVVNLF